VRVHPEGRGVDVRVAVGMGGMLSVAVAVGVAVALGVSVATGVNVELGVRE
jgi:hypothetical protein